MKLELSAVEGLPEVAEGDDLAALIAERAELADGDIVIVAQKIVSKAEGRTVSLSSVSPSPRALQIAAETEKDPRLVELVLGESRSLLRRVPGVLIVETRNGFVCANAGIDSSNVPGEDQVLLLPEDADASARELRAGLARLTGRQLAVIMTDSFGRAWRSGQSDVAIGCAGLNPLLDLRGSTDREGRTLSASLQAVADELAAAADLVRGKADGLPVVLVRGRADLVTEADGNGAVASLRPRERDLFR